MKKRILSLVLCAVMLLSMCLFMGAGVTQDAAEAAGEVPQTAVFTEAGPFRPAVSVRPQPLRAAADRAAGGCILDDILYDLPGRDLCREPVSVHFRRKFLPEDEVLHHRGRVAPLDDIVRVGVGDGAQADGLALQHR